MVGVVEDLGMDVVLDYSNLLEAAAGIATAGGVAAPVNDDHNHLVAVIMEALGPRGRGFVAVRGVPQFRELRDKLLPLAKEIALMPEAQLPSFLRVSMLLQPRYRTLSVRHFVSRRQFLLGIPGR
jgi:hypothetical protein